MRRAVATIALALSLLGCAGGGGGSSAGSIGQPIALLTAMTGCYAGGESGATDVLAVDPTYGTAFGGKPVLWPEGFTGMRLASGDVEVRSKSGDVVATTGRIYHISFAAVFTDAAQRIIDKTGAFPAAAGCGYPWDFIDCTATTAASDEPIGTDGMYTAYGEAALYCGLWHPEPSM